ncbi:signal peptidase II [Microbacterium sp. Gd 4-13]|uniref:signal peptidase II n=1 Tax=Microbacterium sp. Gd 4-13 TaxID=2173179 RepID=UPI000D56D2AF|nr:signal peptidase II [Microbacterium sp. Gd 4-13]PVW02022.1 signal peptidase II [Microbacterium sp. Gd 4-13]
MRPLQARAFAWACLAAAGVVLVDQSTKALAITMLSTTTRVPLLGDAFGLQLAFNPGAAFSLGAGSTGVITAITFAAVVFLTRAATRATSPAWAAGIGLIWGAAIGNLLDRLLAPPGFGVGQVTDFLAYGELFIGNIADAALFVGFAVLGWQLYRESRQRRRSQNVRLAPTAAEASE